MGATHYASMLYPARCSAIACCGPGLREHLLAWMDTGENEASLIPQWDASLRFEELAELAGNAEFHLFEAWATVRSTDTRMKS
jgi:hypothetical protein